MDPLTIGLVTAAFGAFSGWMGHLFDSQSKRNEAGRRFRRTERKLCQDGRRWNP